MKVKKLMIWVAVLALLFSCISYDSGHISFLPSVLYWSYSDPDGYVRSFRISNLRFTYFEVTSINGRIDFVFMRRGFPPPLDLPREELLPP